MLFILILAIVGELIAFALLAPHFGLGIALLAALSSGVLMALGASVLLYMRGGGALGPGQQQELPHGPDGPSAGRKHRLRPSADWEPFVSAHQGRSGLTASFDFRNWLEVARGALLGTLACAAGSVGLSFLLFRGNDNSVLLLGPFGTAAVSVLIAAPLFFALGFTRKELVELRRNRSSSIDKLTLCLEKPVFSAVIDSIRLHAGSKGEHRHGAFFVVEVDHLEALVKRHGYAWGNKALRLVADAIKASVRDGDLVARLGGAQFGVFLPGARRDNAAEVAERLRRVVAKIVFEPGGERCPLTVSLGAVVFEKPRKLDDLSRTVDEMLLNAKTAGRNRMELRAI